MPRGKSKYLREPAPFLAAAMKVQRWAYCEKIARAYYLSTMSDEAITEEFKAVCARYHPRENLPAIQI
jgi:hypothetical protein